MDKSGTIHPSQCVSQKLALALAGRVGDVKELALSIKVNTIDFKFV